LFSFFCLFPTTVVTIDTQSLRQTSHFVLSSVLSSIQYKDRFYETFYYYRLAVG